MSSSHWSWHQWFIRRVPSLALLPWPWWEPARWADAVSQVELRAASHSHLESPFLHWKGRLFPGKKYYGKVCFCTTVSPACCKGQSCCWPSCNIICVLQSVSPWAWIGTEENHKGDCSAAARGKWRGTAVHAALGARGYREHRGFQCASHVPHARRWNLSLSFPSLKIITLLRRKLAACAWETGDTILQSHSFFYLSMTWIHLNPKWSDWRRAERKDCLRWLKKKKNQQPRLNSDSLKES